LLLAENGKPFSDSEEMNVCHVIVLLSFALWSTCEAKKSKPGDGGDVEEEKTAIRKSKFFPVFQVVTFPNTACTGSSTRNGTCYTSAECNSKGGSSVGSCASGYGVCCVFILSCGGTSSQNCTYLVQAATTKSPTTAGPCTYTLCRCNSNICRIRLDFTNFNIAGPQAGTTVTANDLAASTTLSAAVASNGGGIGDCTTDTFTLTSPGKSGSPVICGYNTGQHMIVDASQACSLASFNIGQAGNTRQWDIKVTQYACGDQDGGPPGCLQYFSGTSGTLSSYNFPTSSSTVGSSTTHLSSQCYTICFRQNQGYCSVCFTTAITTTNPSPANMQTSFGLSNPTANTAATTITSNSAIDTSCISDYLIIPQATTLNSANNAAVQRICGRIFDANGGSTTTGNSVCTSAMPFQIQFKSDANEVTTGVKVTNPNNNAITNNVITTTNEQVGSPGGIVGFSLNYVEQPCTTATG
jgi:hypothetical protein